MNKMRVKVSVLYRVQNNNVTDREQG